MHTSMDPVAELERSLADDAEEAFSAAFSGQLAFDEELAKAGMTRDVSSNSMNVPYDLSSTSDKPGPYGVTFDIDSARIVKESRNKYVAYTIVILSSRGLDASPVTLDKRYSDFEHLHQTLKKKYSSVLHDVVFPKKLVIGNFKPETIAHRSRSFEQYLAHLYSIDLTRISSEFADFFYGHAVREGFRLVQNGQYDAAVITLQPAIKLQKKLLGCGHPEVVASMCAIVASLAAMEKDKQAQSVAETVLSSIGSANSNSQYLVPLLELSIRLCWVLGKDKKDLEARLQDLRDQGRNMNQVPSLLELTVTHFPPT